MSSSDDHSSPTGWGSALHAVGPYLGLGLQLAFTLVFCIGLGYLADRVLGTPPWLTLVGSGLGLAAALMQLIRITKRPNSSPEQDRQQPPPS